MRFALPRFGMMARSQCPAVTSLFVIAHGVASMTLSNYAKLSRPLSLTQSLARSHKTDAVLREISRRRIAILGKNWQQSPRYIYPPTFILNATERGEPPKGRQASHERWQEVTDERKKRKNARSDTDITRFLRGGTVSAASLNDDTTLRDRAGQNSVSP